LLLDTIKLPQPPATEMFWPPEVDLILSAMEAGKSQEKPPAGVQRRYPGRTPYRVRAMLRLFSDSAHDPPWVLYIRDIDPRGVGFITPHCLPLGYGGVLKLYAPGGQQMRIECTLFRCRQTVRGWYEGAMCFNREQSAFEFEKVAQG
jgi:hypothetical protein